MEFRLNKTQLAEFVAAFRMDKVPKGQRKIQRFGIKRYYARIEAGANWLQVDSGRVKLRLDASVESVGVFLLRDHILRHLLETLRGEKGLEVKASPDGLNGNGTAMSFAAGEYRMYANAADAPGGSVIFEIPD